MSARPYPRICIRPSFEMRMKDMEGTLQYAQRVEEMGFDAIFVGDRMLAQATSAGRVVYAATAVECTTIMAAMAARTKRIEIGVLVYVVPYRRPLQIAKTFASLDAISNGRIIMGVGAGWNAREFEALGLDMSQRGRMLEEAIPLIRKLWSGDAVTFEGRFNKLENVAIAPLPPRSPGPPMWMGSFQPSDSLAFPNGFAGGDRRVLQRIGRLADGWAPLTYSASAKRRISPDHLGEAWRIIAGSADQAGRDPQQIELVHSDWIYVLDGPDAEARGFAAVSKFFGGDWEEARRTYVIGTPAQIVEQLAAQTARVGRKVDSFLLTPISGDPGQLDLIRDQIAPELRRINARDAGA